MPTERPPAPLMAPLRQSADTGSGEIAHPPASVPMTVEPAATTGARPINPRPNGTDNEPASDASNGLRSRPIGSVESTGNPAVQARQVANMSVVSPASISTAETGAMGMSEQTDTHRPIETYGPKLRVSSSGPGKISLNKTARFEIIVENTEAIRAENVIVGIDFPKWVEINSSMPSTGSRETSGNENESRMIWQIPIVESSATEKIVLEVTPREARAFDVDVEWTFKPIRGKSTVEVTQPQLMIQMTGPTEVLYGEKALYHVSVSNPGTGTAENVVVMLPEILGGERASLGNIDPQKQKQFQVELIARSAGPLELVTTVSADNDLSESDKREIMVRRAELEVLVEGPPMKYAGSTATYQLTVANRGDAMARDVIAAVALPPGVEYVSGIEGIEMIEGGIRWDVGMLSPGNHRTYQIVCNMLAAGDINIEAATRGAGDLAATDKIVTRIDAVADLVLSVEDPKGPLPTGEQIPYEISIRNRGTKSARGVNVVMHFSEGIEPIEGEGLSSEVAPGQVTFAPISQIEPGQEVKLTVFAVANQAGAHRFRAQLLCEESDAHEVAEGTTKFYGDTVASKSRNATMPENDSDFKR